MGEDVPSASVDASPFERFEQRSTVSEFGSAGWPFGSAPGREELVRGAGDGHAGDVVGPSELVPELVPEDVGLGGVDPSVSEGGGVGYVAMP